MKKFLYSLLTLSLLALIAVAVLWFSGRIAAKKWEEYLNVANNFIEAQSSDGVTYKLDWKQTHQDLLQTDYKITLKSYSNMDQTKPILQITLLQSIEHGPLPLSELKKFNFSPLWSLSTFTVPSNNIPREQLEREKEQKTLPLATIVVKTLLDNNTQIQGEIFPFGFKSERYPTKTEGGHFSGFINQNAELEDYAISLNALQIKGNSPWIPMGHIVQNLIDNPQSESPHFLSFDKLEFTSTKNPINTNGLSSKNIEVSNLNFNIYQYPILGLEHLSYKLNEVEHNKFVDLENNINLSNLRLYGLLAGSGNTTFVTLHKTNDDAVDFYRLLKNVFSENKLERNDINSYVSFNEIIDRIDSVATLLANNPGYQIIPFTWKTGNGELTAKLELIFADESYDEAPNEMNASNAQAQTSVFSKINSFLLDIEADTGVIPELVTIYDQLIGINKQDSLEKNNRIIAQNLDILSNYGFIALQNNKVDFIFSYGNDLFGLNGVTYTRNQFIEYLSILSTLQNGLMAPTNVLQLNNMLMNGR